MDRVYSMGSRLFGTLAAALLLLAPLTVPQNAFATAGATCESACVAKMKKICGTDKACLQIFGPECLLTCLEANCNSNDGACITKVSAAFTKCSKNCNGNVACLKKCAVAVVTCTSASPTCMGNTSATTCYPGKLANNYCPTGSPDCACRWVAVGKDHKCVCQNISGN